MTWTLDGIPNHLADEVTKTLRRSGDLTGAGSIWEGLLDRYRGLAAADPANTEWQRDLSVSRNKIGDVARARGRLDDAATAYEEGRQIAERLAAADPTNTYSQRDLLVGLIKIGDVATARGRLDDAAITYEEGRQICQRRHRRRSHQHRVAAVSVGQPGKDRRRGHGPGPPRRRGDRL
ncbi:tetratricopeptide repeat protein [Amorphus orientalis]|uniref:Tetratricopeptide (TPR) repeat protein n=1 Tax=Amorphus orientalis TaxID=649198 RepID=A0AAE3VMT1_9HYPH|nr:tetratricopeptide repeat protein [Amorphus orientalis]MDQ0314948.1 tetratricopeptide (TPR) repeat protein [Amorphus orientalis]